MRPNDKTAEEKLRAVFDTLQMSEEERGAYCRDHGLYTHHLEEWKKQIIAGLQPLDSKENKAEYRQITAENKELKRELNRKEKALAEASALLILKKKANNGGPMKGSTMLAMLQKLGVVPSFSRPSVSNDNPYSESMFRTLKYCPMYPSKPFFSVLIL